MIKDFFKLAAINISHRRKRSWLTVLGILIGIAAVVSLISVSTGMQEAISAQFELLGTNKVFVLPGGGGAISGGFGTLSAAKLTEHDVNLIKNVRGVEDAQPILLKSAKITYNNQIKYTNILGIDPSAAWIVGNLKIEGRVFRAGEKYSAVIGYNYPQEKIFTKSLTVGNRFEIENQSFKVSGVLQEIGNSGDDSQIYIPIATARVLFDAPDEISIIYVEAKDGFDPLDVADAITLKMRQDRDEKKGEEDFTVQTTAQLIETFKTILGIIQSILIGIAAISLLVGAVGIMNTMYTSVLERTKEIGIMKAVGAQNHDIWAIFLVESGLFGLIGGVAGCTLGLAMAKGVEIYAKYAGFGVLKASLSPWLIALGLGLAFAIGALSGMLPARAAAKLKPATALRYE